MKTLRRFLVLFAAALMLAPGARAMTLTDMWWVPSESGWGANVVEQGTLVFLTLYVYGPDGRPVWYVAPAMAYDESVTNAIVYTGDLYTTTGPPLGSFFDPNGVTNRLVGRVSFRSAITSEATLTYIVDGLTTTKNIERFTFRGVLPTGTYHGAVVKAPESNCLGTPLGTAPVSTTFTITTSTSGNRVTVTIQLLDGSLGGELSVFGSYSEVAGTWTLGGSTYDSLVFDLSVDEDGIRGKIVASSRLGGCAIGVRFAGARAF